ncbi:MAG: polysaccharide pyruvyl transferase CsaB [Clostridia bacterium]|nr:polysaccharide pyruvyl transferase CsaB [Clostridia bacterium]
MKVMHLISGGDSGGAKTHLFELLDKLKLSCEVSVACLMKGPFYQEILGKDIDSHLFLQKNRFDLSVVDDIHRFISEKNIELLHVHGARANFIAMFLKCRLSIPVVTTMHSDYLLDFDEIFKRLVFTNLNILSLRRLDYFIAVSHSFRDMLINRNFRPNGIYTVYNGMDFSKIPQSVTGREDYAKKYNLSLDEKLCYVGIAARFDVVKGVDVFIKAAAKAYEKNKNLRFLIAGTGAEEKNLKALAKKLGVEDVVKFLGFERDIYGFLNFININTLTSKCESFPYSMLEGAAMKKPMIASAVGGIPALVKEGETGFVFANGDFEAMAEKILELSGNKELINSMGEAICKKVNEEFSADVFARTHMEIYSQIIKDYKAKKKYDFVLSGYFGFNNSGDDALLKALIKDLKCLNPTSRIAVLSRKPKATRRMFCVDSVGRMSPFCIWKTFKKSSVLLSGGGSLIQDETSSKSLWYYLTLISFAKKCGMKVMQIANGIGPVNRENNRRLAAKVINKNVDSITLREDKSAVEIEKLGVNIPFEITADPAISLNGESRKRVDAIFKENSVPSGDYICVAIRDWKQFAPGFKRSLALSLDYLSGKYNKNIVFLPMQYPLDIEISKAVASKMQTKAFIIETPCTIEETIGIIKYSSLVLAMRLHSLVYAVSCGVGVIALKYDPKIDGFMNYFRQSLIANVESVTEAELKHIIDRFFEGENKEATESLCAEMRLKASRNAKLAVELLEKCNDR